MVAFPASHFVVAPVTFAATMRESATQAAVTTPAAMASPTAAMSVTFSASPLVIPPVTFAGAMWERTAPAAGHLVHLGLRGYREPACRRRRSSPPCP